MEEQLQLVEYNKSKSLDYVEMFKLIWYSRKLILIVTGILTVFAILISLLLPETFKSTAIILPDTDKSKLTGLGSLSDFAMLAGISAGDASIVKLYPTIIKSETVLKNVIYKKYRVKGFPDSVNLIQYWEIEEKNPERSFEVALKTLRDELDVSNDIKLNVVTISIETRDPNLSADILNAIIMELDFFLRNKKKTNASEQRKWIEGRLIEVKEDLTKAENRLKEFRERNRSISSSPQLMLEQERLVREVQINSTMYVELKKQNEIIKIEEIKNIPIVNVLDSARPAAKKTGPQRASIVIVIFFLSLIGSIGYVLFNDRYKEKLIEYKRQFTKI